MMLQLEKKILRGSMQQISVDTEARKTMTSVETFMETGSEVQAYSSLLHFFLENTQANLLGIQYMMITMWVIH